MCSVTCNETQGSAESLRAWQDSSGLAHCPQGGQEQHPDRGRVQPEMWGAHCSSCPTAHPLHGSGSLGRVGEAVPRTAAVAPSCFFMACHPCEVGCWYQWYQAPDILSWLQTNLAVGCQRGGTWQQLDPSTDGMDKRGWKGLKDPELLSTERDLQEAPELSVCHTADGMWPIPGAKKLSSSRMLGQGHAMTWGDVQAQPLTVSSNPNHLLIV